MSARQFLATVGAYLTGWLIAQNLYRLANRSAGENFKLEVTEYICDELEARGLVAERAEGMEMESRRK